MPWGMWCGVWCGTRGDTRAYSKYGQGPDYENSHANDRTWNHLIKCALEAIDTKNRALHR